MEDREVAMAVCKVVVNDGHRGNIEFPEIPHTGDYVILAPGNPPALFRVDRVVIAPIGLFPEVAEISVSRVR
jgi:hypothetical protein